MAENPLHQEGCAPRLRYSRASLFVVLRFRAENDIQTSFRSCLTLSVTTIVHYLALRLAEHHVSLAYKSTGRLSFRRTIHVLQVNREQEGGATERP